MNSRKMLDFLMENDVVLHSPNTDRYMTTDEAEYINGEFVVYTKHGKQDLYRGKSLENALRVLENR